MYMEYHPIASIFPLMGDDQLKDLSEDIRLNGQQYPVITFEGKILDGRNRFRACQMAGVEPEIEEFEGTKADALKAVWSWNVSRRHLGSDQVAVALGLRLKLDAEFAKEVEAIRQEQPKGGRPKAGEQPEKTFSPVSKDERATDHTERSRVAATLSLLRTSRMAGFIFLVVIASSTPCPLRHS